MTPSQVFSAWTSTSSSKDQEAESASEEDARPELAPSTKSERKNQWNGSEENTTVPSTTDISSYLNYFNFNFSILSIYVYRDIEGLAFFWIKED
jgi:hypothetical protein